MPNLESLYEKEFGVHPNQMQPKPCQGYMSKRLSELRAKRAREAEAGEEMKGAEGEQNERFAVLEVVEGARRNPPDTSTLIGKWLPDETLMAAFTPGTVAVENLVEVVPNIEKDQWFLLDEREYRYLLEDARWHEIT